MTKANLSEILFKPSFKHQETSTLVQRTHHHLVADMHSALEGENTCNWYRMINRLMWIWRGLDPMEIEMVLARIAASQAEHSDEKLLDTVVGYRSGNWIYEWANQGMLWQQKAAEMSDAHQIAECWLTAANFYSIAGYPHLKGDELAEQAAALANRAYEEAAKFLPYELKELEFRADGCCLSGFLHLPPEGKGPFPTLLICGGLDMLQNDHHRLFSRYLAPAGIAMLTIDMPSVGFSSRWKLTQDTSYLHQQVLLQLPDVPWIDNQRIGVFGFRFGANVAVRLAYLESRRIRAVACMGPVVHSLLCNSKYQDQVPDMYIDMLASRLGMSSSTDAVLKAELCRYSLKTQGLLGRRCPTPMLSGYWKNDPFSPKEDSSLIVNSSQGGKLLQIDSTHLQEGFDRGLQETCRWLKDKLR